MSEDPRFLSISTDSHGTELVSFVRIADVSALRLSVVTTICNDPYTVDILAVMKSGAEVVLQRITTNDDSDPLKDARIMLGRITSHISNPETVLSIRPRG